jgi:hypothetical protein
VVAAKDGRASLPLIYLETMGEAEMEGRHRSCLRSGWGEGAVREGDMNQKGVFARGWVIKGTLVYDFEKFGLKYPRLELDFHYAIVLPRMPGVIC